MNIKKEQINASPVNKKFEEEGTQKQISSPYIGLMTSNLSKEQKQENMKRLKDEIKRRVEGSNEEIKHREKNILFQNAFNLNIKNKKEEVMKDMETLRKSVKLKKRANPLEKQMSKLAQKAVKEEQKT